MKEILDHMYSVLIRYTVVKRHMQDVDLKGPVSTPMTTPDQDTHWMYRALDLARRGLALASPNPAVGCVIVDGNGKLIGEGWHEYDLLDHAEIAALKNRGCPIHSAGSAEWVGSESSTRLRGATA